ncbi:hypothetical protein SDC9_114427 [bioreactor metagenome]|uniref:Uncharacterized protein n=1 Tax=bioreactor metagenome TaxID=1076179 RepID=A0A645C0K2_9ZZZZ
MRPDQVTDRPGGPHGVDQRVADDPVAVDTDHHRHGVPGGVEEFLGGRDADHRRHPPVVRGG